MVKRYLVVIKDGISRAITSIRNKQIWKKKI